ncbi:hypothetical protein [Streptomyces sp. NPDC020996]|uniref:hypothetical protein n=1 Tax=Streptomyces sp. NPDC020996 TaxID=3154791 RepID=UPI0033DD7AF4
MTTPSAPEPVPIRVLLPVDQEVVARLWSRRQVPDGRPDRHGEPGRAVPDRGPVEDVARRMRNAWPLGSSIADVVG